MQPCDTVGYCNLTLKRCRSPPVCTWTAEVGLVENFPKENRVRSETRLKGHRSPWQASLAVVSFNSFPNYLLAVRKAEPLPGSLSLTPGPAQYPVRLLNDL